MAAKKEIQISKLPMPASSWVAIKRIILAYLAVANRENPSVELVAEKAELPRTAVSGNNSFLRALGILEPDKNRLTETGTHLAHVLQVRSRAWISEALQPIIQDSADLAVFLTSFEEMPTMKLARFKAELLQIAGLDPKKSWHLGAVKTLIDLFKEAGVIELAGDEVLISFAGYSAAQDSLERLKNTRSETRSAAAPETASRKRIPIPLGIDRTAYLELPEDWASRDVQRLLSVIQLTLGDEAEKN